ncbi:hypothetical protein XENTR_v10015001 [Xenopus tropicalis]|nr:hypothetical protein XENTR_v10015001 [Xenopus tropicalis]
MTLACPLNGTLSLSLPLTAQTSALRFRKKKQSSYGSNQNILLPAITIWSCAVRRTFGKVLEPLSLVNYYSSEGSLNAHNEHRHLSEYNRGFKI